MGNQQQTEVVTPPFEPSRWVYVPDRPDLHEDYGFFRTLENRSTGDKIDEYEFIWYDQY